MTSDFVGGFLIGAGFSGIICGLYLIHIGMKLKNMNKYAYQ